MICIRPEEKNAFTETLRSHISNISKNKISWKKEEQYISEEFENYLSSNKEKANCFKKFAKNLKDKDDLPFKGIFLLFTAFFVGTI